MPLFALTSTLVLMAAPRVLVLSHSSPPMMPAMQFNNSMVMIGKAAHSRSVRIVSLTPLDLVVEVDSEHVVDLAVDLAVVVALVVVVALEVALEVVVVDLEVVMVELVALMVELLFLLRIMLHPAQREAKSFTSAT